MDAAAAPGGRRDGEEKKEGEKKGNGAGDAGDKRVSFTGLFRYADGTDILLMLLGTVGALANGVTEPIMTIIFGQVIDGFGGGATEVLQHVNKVSLPDHLHRELARCLTFCVTHVWPRIHPQQCRDQIQSHGGLILP